MVVQNGSPFFCLKLLEKVVLVIILKGWIDFEQLLVAHLLVKSRCLKAVGVKDDAFNLLSRGYFFYLIKQLLAVTMAAVFFSHAKIVDFNCVKDSAGNNTRRDLPIFFDVKAVVTRIFHELSIVFLPHLVHFLVDLPAAFLDFHLVCLLF